MERNLIGWILGGFILLVTPLMFGQQLRINIGYSSDIYHADKKNSMYNRGLEWYPSLIPLRIDYSHFLWKNKVAVTLFSGINKPGFGMNLSQYPGLNSAGHGFYGKLPHPSLFIGFTTLYHLPGTSNRSVSYYIGGGLNTRFQQRYPTIFAMAYYYEADNYHEIKLYNLHERNLSFGAHINFTALGELTERINISLQGIFNIGFTNWRTQAYSYRRFAHNQLIESSDNSFSYRTSGIQILVGLAFQIGNE
jgi:hypothetical protein